jgi:hypothetical protein
MIDLFILVWHIVTLNCFRKVESHAPKGNDNER